MERYDLSLLDLVSIVDEKGLHEYIETVISESPPEMCWRTDHFKITDRLQVEEEFGTDDGKKYYLAKVWKRQDNNYVLDWENGKEVGKLKANEDCCKPADIPFEEHAKVLQENEELKDIIIELNNDHYGNKK